MPTMSNSAVRVIDPILTTLVQGYKNQDFIGDKLFPNVNVNTSGGQILTFGKESFQLYSTARSAGSNTKRVMFGYLGKPYALENHALEAVVPREHMRDASVVPGIDLSGRAVNLTMRVITLQLEVQRAKLAQDPANYNADNKVALAGSAKWSNPESNPRADVDAGREAIRQKCGVYPNIMTLGPTVFNALRRHPKIIEQFKYTDSKSITTVMLAEYFDIAEVVVGKAIYFDDAGVAQDIWGPHVELAYVPTIISGMEEPSFAYTYNLTGNPSVETPYYDNNTKSWVYGVSHERAPVIAGMDAGYLLQNVV